MHRDVMAGHNMCNAILGQLEHQQRPLYLQPVDADGSYPWMQQDGKEEPPRESAVRKTPSKKAEGKKAAGKKRKAPSDDTDS